MSLELLTVCGQDSKDEDNLVTESIRKIFDYNRDKSLNSICTILKLRVEDIAPDKYNVISKNNCVSVTNILKDKCVAEIAESHRIAVRENTKNPDKVYYNIYKSRELVDTSWCYAHQIQGVSEVLKSYNQELEITKVEQVRVLNFN